MGDDEKDEVQETNLHGQPTSTPENPPQPPPVEDDDSAEEDAEE